MKFLLSLILLTVAFSFTQCKSSKMITKAIAPRDTTKLVQVNNSDDSLILVNSTRDNIKKSTIDFNTFSAKIKLDIEDAKGKKPDLVANIRMIKDSAIWISISATILNVEVFRVFINKDSVILLNKQEKEVQYRSISYLQEITDIPFDFKTLQNLIIGNPVFFDDKNVTVKKYDDFTLVSSAAKDFKNLLTYTTKDNLLQHSKLDDVDPLRNRTADFTYDSYTNANGGVFSTYRQIIATEKNKLDVRMNFKQFEFNKELSVSFSVPKNYKKN
ncbi:DUF4292 domain-containing protein [Ferruginibacter yonginensis]|uniref:DUF4292 domain-containing protein n=1 Tax=Ferruginibacter yonginensis TaxID=1310416 RepID=A0ABV8QWZ5_9BACT